MSVTKSIIGLQRRIPPTILNFCSLFCDENCVQKSGSKNSQFSAQNVTRSSKLGTLHNFYTKLKDCGRPLKSSGKKSFMTTTNTTPPPTMTRCYFFTCFRQLIVFLRFIRTPDMSVMFIDLEKVVYPPVLLTYRTAARCLQCSSVDHRAKRVQLTTPTLQQSDYTSI